MSDSTAGPATDPLARIGVLMCEHIPVDLQESTGGDYDLVYRRLLHAAEPRLEVITYAVVDGELPASPHECDGWMITGSRESAFSDASWVVAFRDWLASAATAGARIAGVCFGHQMIAEVLGGSVERAETWKVGPQDTIVEPTRWFAGGEVKINAMHKDVVTELPPGARSIATGTTANHPAYLVGDNIMCVQDHPELDADYVRLLIDARIDRIDPDAVESARRRLDDDPTDGPTVGVWLVDFLLDRNTTL